MHAYILGSVLSILYIFTISVLTMMPRDGYLIKDTEHRQVKEFSQGHKLACLEPHRVMQEFVLATANIYHILL